jgi:predicted outer membrane repeat protein
MGLISWLRNRKSSTPARCHRSRCAFRPRLEALETRWLPSTLQVTTTNDSNYYGDGSLRGEIAAATSGDTIDFNLSTTDRGYNSSTGTWTMTLGYVELVINKSLTIIGPGADKLQISGGGSYGSRIFEVDGSTTTVMLSGLSLIDGNGMYDNQISYGGVAFSGGGNHGSIGIASDGQGGAIWNGGNLTVTNCTLSHNAADQLYDLHPPGPNGFGGAIYNAGTMTVTDTILTYNSAGDSSYASHGSYGGSGGAIWNGGTLTVNGTSTLFDHNAAYGFGSTNGGGLGGGIDNAGTLSVSGTVTFSFNSATDGGAIYGGYKTTTNITGASMTNNSAAVGGAVWNDGTMTLSGCTLSANTASSAGGGIYDGKDGHLTIQSASSITGNTAPIWADLDNLSPVKISKDSTIG